uniref:Putative methyltransferase n=1 Tax=viral metagenome TaxID=1070528 RepID=A0A6M3K7Q0_9ZZZZ
MLINRKLDDCPVCSCAYRVVIAHEDRYGVEASWSLCRSCGFIYLDPTWEECEYDRFYEHDYRKLVATYRGPQNLEKNQERYGRALAEFLRRNLGSVDSVCDYGGSGGIVCALVGDALGAGRTRVIEPDPEKAQEATKNVDEVICSSVADAPLDSSDLVLCCRTLDHFTDPVGSLRRLARLPEHGRLYVDYSDWLMVARSEGFTRSLHVDHPSNFTAWSAKRVLTESMLTPVAEFVPPKSSCHGFLCRHDEEPYVPLGTDIYPVVRELQALERKSWLASAY